jgi:hypothetical protein
MRFVSLMNTMRFRPTLAQLTALEESTKAVTGETRVSAFAITEVQHAAGLAVFIKDGYRYLAVRLLSNRRWYLTGEYSY